MGLEIKEFKGTRYNIEKFGLDWTNLTCPPYDVIRDSEREGLISTSPYNFVNLILSTPLSSINNPDARQYGSVRKLIEQWKADGILSREDKEGVYVYKQNYEYHGESKRRYGFIALLRLPDEEGWVLPHEATHEGPKNDRFDLVKNTMSILEPVFFLLPDEGDIYGHIKFAIDGHEKEAVFADNDGKHFCIKIEDGAWIESLKKMTFNKRALIADGHHRYAVAQRFRAHMKESGDYDPHAPYNYIMVYFAPMLEENLTILPINRKALNFPIKSEEELLSRLEKWFDVYTSNDEELASLFYKKEGYEWGLSCKFGKYKIILKDGIDPAQVLRDMGGSAEYRRLYVVVLHKMLFPLLGVEDNEENLFYEKCLYEPGHKIEQGALFVLRPISFRQVYDVSLKGELMPQKSTFFYPKIKSGFVFFELI